MTPANLKKNKRKEGKTAMKKIMIDVFVFLFIFSGKALASCDSYHYECAGSSGQQVWKICSDGWNSMLTDCAARSSAQRSYLCVDNYTSNEYIRTSQDYCVPDGPGNIINVPSCMTIAQVDPTIVTTRCTSTCNQGTGKCNEDPGESNAPTCRISGCPQSGDSVKCSFRCSSDTEDMYRIYWRLDSEDWDWDSGDRAEASFVCRNVGYGQHKLEVKGRDKKNVYSSIKSLRFNCDDTRCSSVRCDPYCNGSDLYKSSSCSAGICNYNSIEHCTAYLGGSCSNGTCVIPVCNSHAQKVCSNSKLYFQNSCGTLEDLAEDCQNRCENGACTELLQSQWERSAYQKTMERANLLQSESPDEFSSALVGLIASSPNMALQTMKGSLKEDQIRKQAGKPKGSDTKCLDPSGLITTPAGSLIYVCVAWNNMKDASTGNAVGIQHEISKAPFACKDLTTNKTFTVTKNNFHLNVYLVPLPGLQDAIPTGNDLEVDTYTWSLDWHGYVEEGQNADCICTQMTYTLKGEKRTAGDPVGICGIGRKIQTGGQILLDYMVAKAFNEIKWSIINKLNLPQTIIDSMISSQGGLNGALATLYAGYLSRTAIADSAIEIVEAGKALLSRSASGGIEIASPSESFVGIVMIPPEAIFQELGFSLPEPPESVVNVREREVKKP